MYVKAVKQSDLCMKMARYGVLGIRSACCNNELIDIGVLRISVHIKLLPCTINHAFSIEHTCGLLTTPITYDVTRLCML